MTLTRKRIEITVTETVIGKETRDAKETATGTVTAREIGTVTDGTPVRHPQLSWSFLSLLTIILSCFSSQLEAGAVAVAVAITGSLKTESDATTCVSLVLSSNVASYHCLILSVDDARARVRHILVLVLLPAHDVDRVPPAAVVRVVRVPELALRAAVHATVIASRRKHSRVLLAGR